MDLGWPVQFGHGFGQRHPPPLRIWPEGVPWGGCPRVSVCVGTSEICVKNQG
jgi:hypothetical protein